MGNAFRIGRAFGIELRVDPSWLFVFALIGWSLTSLFASWHPDWSLALCLVIALTTALVFFGSVLLHEMAHSLVARLFGIPVRDITLHLFGGVSNIEREPPTPEAEFLIAIAGPIVSIGLGIALLLASVFAIHVPAEELNAPSAVLAHLGPIATIIMWLGPVNVMVGLFNLIPGFPLDGGRILRSLIWKFTGNFSRATEAASTVGQLVGWLFVGLGALMAFGYRVPFFGQGLTSGIWLAMIGLFLRNAALMHLRGAAIEEALAGMRVQDVMRTNGPVVAPDVPVRSLIDGWFMRHDVTAFPVMQNARLLGIITIEDIRKIEAAVWERVRVEDVMTPVERLIIASPEEPLASALQKLGSKDVRQLPVIDDSGVLIGVLFEKDVAKWLALRAQLVRRAPQPWRVRHAS